MNLDALRTYTPTRQSGDTYAAVLLPLILDDGQPRLVFIRRSEAVSRHPGQMGFPGGRREQEDQSLEATARREADEEIALPREQPEIIGRLDDIHTVTGYVVSPFVSRIPAAEYRPNSPEVAEVVTLPFPAFLQDEVYEAEWHDHPVYGEHLVPYFHVDGYTVWGATGRILLQFLELVTDWQAGSP